MKYIIGLLFLTFSISVSAQDVLSTDQLLRQSEQRQRVIDDRLSPEPERFPQTILAPIKKQTDDKSTPCFFVTELQLTILNETELLSRFSKFVKIALRNAGVKYQKINDLKYNLLSVNGVSPCLSAVSIQNLNADIQNMLINKGWVTSRVLVPDQSLTDGKLILSLASGVLSDIYVDKTDSGSTYANRANIWTAFPVRRGKPLNLRDLEQGLENLRRLPTVAAEMNIIPSKKPSTSNVEVKWKQKKNPVRFNISVDDSGSESTGEKLATLGLALDNPLRINDILSISYTQNLTPGSKESNPQGGEDIGGTNSYSINYSIPYGYWSVDTSVSRYFYDQVVAGVNRNYHYTGTSDQINIGLSRVLYRDNQSKVTANLSVWKKDSRSFINDAEVDVQRRRTSGIKANVSQRSYLKNGTFSSVLGYRRGGLTALGAKSVPEELLGEASTRAPIWTLDIDWSIPIRLKKINFNSQTSFHGQWNTEKLISQDRISIGGRHSVRGFSGKKSLSADRGWYIRENLSWSYSGGHQLYLGVDVGNVFGESSEPLAGKTLSGMVLGLKGGHRYHGNWHYDVFLGTQLDAPGGFESDDIVSGFNIGYSY